MKAIMLAALLAGTPTLAAAQQPPASKEQSPKTANPAPKADSKPETAKKSDELDMAQMMAFIDKIFPAQPDPAPARLALARSTAAGMFPDGTYAGMFNDMMGGVVDRVLSMSPADLGEKKDGEDNLTLRQELARDDPHFEERMRITRKVIGEELVKITAILEPRLRDGLARSIARRFDEKQLGEINAFLATDAGRAFGSQSMRMWIDPDVMRSMIASFPDMMKAMPSAVQRLEAETAHLPKPPKKEAEEPAADEADEADEEAVEAELPEA